jgi:hypothetical protein
VKMSQRPFCAISCPLLPGLRPLRLQQPAFVAKQGVHACGDWDGTEVRRGNGLSLHLAVCLYACINAAVQVPWSVHTHRCLLRTAAVHDAHGMLWPGRYGMCMRQPLGRAARDACGNFHISKYTAQGMPLRTSGASWHHSWQNAVDGGTARKAVRGACKTLHGCVNSGLIIIDRFWRKTEAGK